MSGEAFFRVVEKLRLALLTTIDLTDRERRLALLMVERIHRRSYEDADTLVSWLSVPTIAALTGIDERSIKRLRQSLRAKSVVHIEQEGGRGPRSTAVYAFAHAWIERNAPAIGACGGWTSSRRVTEADPEVSTLATDPTSGWVASTATLWNDMGGYSSHPGMASETPLKGGFGDHPTPLNTKLLIEPLETRANASATRALNLRGSVPTEPIADPASLIDGEFAAWLTSARAGMSVPLARLAKSSGLAGATLVAIESGLVVATSIVRSRIVHGLRQLSRQPTRLQIAGEQQSTASPVDILAVSDRRPSRTTSLPGKHAAAHRVDGMGIRRLSCRDRGMRVAAAGVATSARGGRSGPTSISSNGVAELGIDSIYELFREAWQLEHGGGRKAEAVWLAWFSRAESEGVEDGRLQIVVPSRAARDYLWSKYDDLTERAARRVGLSGADVVPRGRE
jgi:hypothetical protein